MGVVLVFLAWAYDKLKIGFGLHGTGVSDKIASDYYYLHLPSAFFASIGLVHLGVIVCVLLGLFKRPTRGYLLVLTVAPLLSPYYWTGLYEAILVVPHPTILFYSSTALFACAYMVYALRDYDYLASAGNKRTPNFSDAAFRRKLGSALFVCRLAVFIIFFVWVYSKIVWPEKGVERMQNFWLIPGFPEWGVTVFAWVELAICFIFLAGFFKRWTAGFFVFLGVMAVFSPRVMGGMKRVFMDDSWHTILLYPGICLLVCSIVLYLLRDFDTRFTMNKRINRQIQAA